MTEMRAALASNPRRTPIYSPELLAHHHRARAALHDGPAMLMSAFDRTTRTCRIVSIPDVRLTQSDFPIVAISLKAMRRALTLFPGSITYSAIRVIIESRPYQGGVV